jgi:hypothetical protein
VNAQTLIARLDAALAGYGQTVTLQRTSVDSATGAVTVTESVDCPAVVRPTGPQDLEAGDVVPIRRHCFADRDRKLRHSLAR